MSKSDWLVVEHIEMKDTKGAWCAISILGDVLAQIENSIPNDKTAILFVHADNPYVVMSKREFEALHGPIDKVGE
jgi:hypothetical protein